MTKNIFIFGDSYSTDKHYVQKPWSTMLHETYGYNVTNYAVGGSSTDYSVYKFFECVAQNKILPGDCVIFQTSSVGRLHFNYQIFERPDTGSTFSYPEDAAIKENYQWYLENDQNLVWYLTNRNHTLETIKDISYLHLIKSYAEVNPDILVILLKLQDIHSFENNLEMVQMTPQVKTQNNFLVPDIGLYPISIMEADQTYQEFTEYTRWDIRQNHLTLPNRQILADCIHTAIETKSVDHIKYEIFKKSIIGKIKCQADFEKCVADGVLENFNLAPNIWKN